MEAPAATAKDGSIASPALKKRNYDEMTREDLIAQLESKQAEIAQLKKKLKVVVTPEKGETSAPTMNIPKLRDTARRAIQQQMKWKKTMKHSDARWSWSALIGSEANYRAFLDLAPEKPTKLRVKLSQEEFKDLMGGYIIAHIRYGFLELKGDYVNVAFNRADCEIKITGKYGL